MGFWKYSIEPKITLFLSPLEGLAQIMDCKVDQAYLFLNALDTMADKKKKMNTTKDDYDKALVSDDPTKVTTIDLESLAKEAMKKFKSL
jgi:hypothetical protein